ncbi:MAG: methylmalonyl-CoA mutase family protein, partial [Tunicatimonas sp.]|uniref:methylmalonyl-CoA mutase family protein n=1 Tax=Tunicatimonas sp. TaxID=1940096 RepID=UPI003C78F453
MFDKFQPKTEREWIEQANKETRTFESISFPHLFQLENLKLSAINTYQSANSNKKLVKYIISNKSAYPSISLMLAEQLKKVEFESILQYGLEDLFLTLDQALSSQIIDKSSNSPELQSIAVTYEHSDSNGLASFVERFVKEQRLNMTLYNSLLISRASGLSNQQTADLAILINKYHNDQIQLLGIRGDILGNYGATVVQELAASLSLLVAQWDILTNQGVSIASLVAQTELALSLSGEFYLDIVKFKAARVLIYYLLDAYETEDTNPNQVKLRAISGTLNKSLYDPDANLLRNTVESLAATVGEADIITLRSHDYQYRQTTEFGSRMAANIQHLFRHEASLHETKNPADGSYFFEKAIDDVVKQAWELFQAIEGEGGYYQSGLTDATLCFRPNTRKKERELLQQKKAVIGVTRYANIQEKITENQVADRTNSPSQIKLWEDTRQRVDNLSEDKKPVLTILGPLNADKSIVRKKITFVIEILATIGLPDFTVDNSLETILEKGRPDVLIFCGDNAWYESHLVETTSHPELTSVPKVAVGKMSLLVKLQQEKVLDAVIHSRADLSPLFNVIKQVLP